MTDTVAELKKYRPEVTVRMLDNAIWKYAKVKYNKKRKITDSSGGKYHENDICTSSQTAPSTQ